MTENLPKLFAVYKPDESGDVTPARIQDQIQGEGRLTPEAFFNLLPGELHDLFYSRKGKGALKLEKQKRFLRYVDELMDRYTAGQLFQMSEECIGKDGRIFPEILDKILNGEEEI